MDLLQELNPMQQEAVLCKEGPLLLLAGAGSGKTRVLTHRIAYLIQNGVRPCDILAITFTNKASKEMRLRVNDLVESGAENVWVSTFHSMCVRILRKDIEKIGYERNFSIYDSDDQEKLIKECLGILKFDEKLFIPKGVMAEISSLKNELITCKQYERETEGDFRKSKIAQIYSMYQKKLKSYNALDFDDLIFKTIDLFKEVPEILEFYQERFKYIMVDEYQDTNTAQYQLVRYLAEKHKNLCVVGDDDQSIYGWRGANIRNILDFEKDFPNATTIKLEQNYRSTQTILYAANSVIKNNTKRKRKSLWTENDEGDKINLVKTPTQFDEAQFIADEIRTLVKSGKQYNDFALLYRTNAQSRTLEEKLVQTGIPYRLLGGTRFYDRKEIKDALAYLKTINNPIDDLSIKRIINVPKRGIGDTTINKISNLAFEDDIHFFKALVDNKDNVEVSRNSKKLADFVELIYELRNVSNESSVSELIDIILDKTGYIKELTLEGTPESLSRIENLKELISKAVEYESNSEDPSLGGFLEEVALVADVDNYQQDSNTVVLMTLHSSKGLEFPYVFITGMEEGVFPSYRILMSNNENELEEERRLCYVGITRAKEQLYFVYSQSRMLGGNTQYNQPSRFLKEVPKSLLETNIKQIKTHEQKNEVESSKKPVEKIAYRPQFEKTKPYQSININNSPTPVLKEKAFEFSEGDKIKHKKFGIGVIKEVKPSKDGYEIFINFENFGDKKLISTIAKLEKI